MNAARAGLGFIRLGTVGLTRIGLIAVCCFVTHRAVGQTLISLGPMGGSYSRGAGLNEMGLVAGTTTLANNGHGMPALFSNGSAMGLGTLGRTDGEANDVNNAGQATGLVFGGGTTLGFIYSNGVMTSLGGLGGTNTWGEAINDAGQVTGLSATATGNTLAFLYANGSMQSLGTLGGDNSYGFDINASGQVTGVSDRATGQAHAFLYSNGVMQDLGALGGGGSVGKGINDLGEVVGTGNVAGSYDQTAFLYSHGTMTGLGTLGGFASAANDLNNLGQVVGTSMINSDYLLSHAFIYSDGVMRDLNTVYSGLLSDGSTTGFLYLASAEDINDRGQITGYGKYFDGVTVSERGFLLNTQPLPPPSVPEETATLGLLMTAALGLVCGRAGLRLGARSRKSSEN